MSIMRRVHILPRILCGDVSTGAPRSVGRRKLRPRTERGGKATHGLSPRMRYPVLGKLHEQGWHISHEATRIRDSVGSRRKTAVLTISTPLPCWTVWTMTTAWDTIEMGATIAWQWKRRSQIRDARQPSTWCTKWVKDAVGGVSSGMGPL